MVASNGTTEEAETRLFIGNDFVEGAAGKTFTLVNPSTGEDTVKVFEAGAEDIDRAVALGEKAWPAWAALPAYERGATLRRLATLVRQAHDLIAKVESRTNGKPVSQFGFDIAVTAGCLDYFASLCETRVSTTSQTTPGQHNFVLRVPYGVTAAIIPWNSPTIMFAFKIGASVAAGNACILKTSEKAPLTPLILAQLSVEAGFPAGLISVVHGGGETGRLLCEHMKIRKLSFTGSTKTGRAVACAAANSNLKSVTLELGGKSPAIVFADSDVEGAAAACAFSILQLAGQVCMATSRVYVEASIKDRFLEAYKGAFGAIAGKPGPATEHDTTHGPQVDVVQYEQVKRFLAAGEKEAKTVMGGKAIEGKGFFIAPTIFTDASDDATISRQEIFGPVGVVNAFDTEAEAIARCNDSDYGLYASVFTKDIDRALRVAAQLDAGSVGVNCTAPTLAADMPFGGTKSSGMGRELGPGALDAWQEVKSVFVKVAPA